MCWQVSIRGSGVLRPVPKKWQSGILVKNLGEGGSDKVAKPAREGGIGLQLKSDGTQC